MLVHKWFKYCWWYFGIASARTFTDLSAFDGEFSIEDVHSDTCGNKQTFTESNCPDLCGNITNFKAAGGVMISFGLLSGCFGIALILLSLIKHYRPEFQFNYIIVLGILQTAFYASGLLAYTLIAQLENLKTDDQGLSGDSEPADVTIEVGMYLAIVACGCSGLLVLLSHFKTVKAFKKVN
eukprot:CAMPEP_0204913228 /NCGR_PEP_ID=MMETSP1397-20131031/11179_1 /ASSEMBLY_ACC=CAM_ASM_000891 /TAXON_ID=49980 /ORGANISM="Climacostomum Climacostomum virens, Strain Stock W-24" /LENGTH=180 /DNA_ID=CAMNT_0052084417 /DNA_START=356 /DNA_END=898 /DNA_ORIENTATION=+